MLKIKYMQYMKNMENAIVEDLVDTTSNEHIEEVIFLKPLQEHYMVSWNFPCVMGMSSSPTDESKGIDSLMLLLSFVMLGLIVSHICNRPQPIAAYVVDDGMHSRKHANTKQDILHV